MDLEKLRRLCKERNMTFASLEKAAGMANGAISKWAVSYPRADNLRAVSDCLGVSMEELLAADAGQGREEEE